MREKCAEWPNDEEMAFVNAGGDILDISDPPPEVIQRVTETLQKEWGLSEATTDWLANRALRGSAKSVPSSVRRNIENLFVD